MYNLLYKNYHKRGPILISLPLIFLQISNILCAVKQELQHISTPPYEAIVNVIAFPNLTSQKLFIKRRFSFCFCMFINLIPYLPHCYLDKTKISCAFFQYLFYISWQNNNQIITDCHGWLCPQLPVFLLCIPPLCFLSVFSLCVCVCVIWSWHSGLPLWMANYLHTCDSPGPSSAPTKCNKVFISMEAMVPWTPCSVCKHVP